MCMDANDAKAGIHLKVLQWLHIHTALDVLLIEAGIDAVADELRVDFGGHEEGVKDVLIFAGLV